jgi:hypothetical protein
MNDLIFHGNHICVERETGLEPATPCLEGRNSTTELLPQTESILPQIFVGKQEEDLVLHRLFSPNSNTGAGIQGQVIHKARGCPLWTLVQPRGDTVGS